MGHLYFVGHIPVHRKGKLHASVYRAKDDSSENLFNNARGRGNSLAAAPATPVVQDCCLVRMNRDNRPSSTTGKVSIILTRVDYYPQ